ncbi:MAG: hypothetical protein BGWL_c2040 [Candidatus Phytoplasma cynodontis]|uniref:hypothetical protein n=1 Tax='Cynodon dactylon' phytoplasma TaxID=295320 RepID=UPI001265AD4E|nr:hypothetical protein ['Cynodon dactylon' phytoplasma]KAB8121723.1 hypothetical protein F1741_01975 ['Cynodon dactylon' phytoplasma]WIA07693.1 MAG: hypothetical protein BGWL_c2040 [Candidatus Phytoplasma cynodontis]
MLFLILTTVLIYLFFPNFHSNLKKKFNNFIYNKNLTSGEIVEEKKSSNKDTEISEIISEDNLSYENLDEKKEDSNSDSISVSKSFSENKKNKQEDNSKNIIISETLNDKDDNNDIKEISTNTKTSKVNTNFIKKIFRKENKNEEISKKKDIEIEKVDNKIDKILRPDNKKSK